MSQYTRDPDKCQMVQDDLAELALGILAGRERAEVLDHLESCAHCGAELESLSTAADTLLMLTPEIEPPLGFESRLSEKLREAAQRDRSRRFRRVSAFAIAAVLVAVLGFGVGVFVSNNGTGSPNRSVAAAPALAQLTSNGRVMGQVVISTDQPTWMFVTVDSAKLSGDVSCEVTLNNGQTLTVGWFNLSGDYSAWAARLTVSAAQVRSARIVAADGAVIASARLSV
jgi:anti-sigma-K factor RskA